MVVIEEGERQNLARLEAVIDEVIAYMKQADRS
jgi:hypothetical protein